MSAACETKNKNLSSPWDGWYLSCYIRVWNFWFENVSVTKYPGDAIPLKELSYYLSLGDFQSIHFMGREEVTGLFQDDFKGKFSC